MGRILSLLYFCSLLMLVTNKDSNTGKPVANSTVTQMTSKTPTTTSQTMTTTDVTSVSVSTSDAKGNQTDSSSEGLLEVLLKKIQDKEILIAFGIGVVLTASICCLTKLCCRIRRKTSLHNHETLEMVSTHTLKLLEGEQDKAGAAGEAEGPPPEVEYSDLDFSAIHGQRAADTHKSTESEYAEIKREPMTGTAPNEEEVQGEVPQDVLEAQPCDGTVEGEEQPLCEIPEEAADEDVTPVS